VFSKQSSVPILKGDSTFVVFHCEVSHHSLIHMLCFSGSEREPCLCPGSVPPAALLKEDTLKEDPEGSQKSLTMGSTHDCGRACRTLHSNWGLPAASGPQDKKTQERNKGNVRSVLSYSLTLFLKTLPFSHHPPYPALALPPP